MDAQRINTMKTPRRTTLRILTMALFTTPWLLAKQAAAQSTKLKATPQDVEGPYYPTSWSGDVDNDLTLFNGKKYAGGIPMALSGRVRGDSGEVLQQARVEIWQIDDVGEYRHPAFGGEAPALRGFQGYGRVLTDAKGQYQFKTIKPIGYGGRPPHVHFKVIAAGYRDLITEMYFAGDNAEGSLYQRLLGGFSKERALLTVSPTVERVGAVEVLNVVFDITLARVG
jgi:protocatechuate 3,4-dioxygenase, beta subunit